MKAPNATPPGLLGSRVETTAVPAGLVGTWTAFSVLGVRATPPGAATLTFVERTSPKVKGRSYPYNGTADDTCNSMGFAAAFGPGSRVRLSPGVTTAVACLGKIPDFTTMFTQTRSYSAITPLSLHGDAILTFYDSQHKLVGVFQRSF
jgi:hypothetical protein